jgi:predicted Ser/Thr protein kinase
LPKIVINRNKILGRGSHVFVYEGTWEETRVAVKRIQIVDTYENAKEDYALRKCDHPNVIRLLGIYSDNIEFK